MRYFPLVLVAAAGCSGDGGKATDEDCEELAPIDVTVTVLDPSEAPVVDAPVKLDGVDCTNNTDGTYLCVAQPDADNQLSIIDTRYDVHAEFLVDLVFECEPGTWAHQVQLGAMMGS